MQKIKSEKIEPFSKKEEHNKRNDKNGQKICMIYIYIYINTYIYINIYQTFHYIKVKYIYIYICIYMQI